MVAFKTVLALAVIAAVAITFAACDRTITVQEQVVGPQSCFDCHNDQNTFLIAAEEQWKNSVHASGLRINEGSSATCAGCHISEGFIQRANGEVVTAEMNPTVIHCFTCHQPHTAGNFGLRWTQDAALLNGTTFDLHAGNLCAACHHARRSVDAYVGTVPTNRVTINSTHWGPHSSVQADMVIGSNGYEYAGYTYETVTHQYATTATDSLDACLECHFKATSNNVVGGHSFNMRGELVEEGGALQEVLNVAACEPCHGPVDDFNIDSVQDDVNGQLATLGTLLEGAGLLSGGSPVANVTTSVDTAGAVWNYLMVEADRSHGVHNANYILGLLDSSILFMSGDLAANATALNRAAALPSRRGR